MDRFALRVAYSDIAGLPSKAQALVAFLAMQPSRRVPRETLADLLWTQSGSQQARQSLRQMLVLLNAPSYAGRKREVLAALAGAGLAK